MPEIIRGGAVVADDWQILRPAPETPLAGVEVPAGRFVVPLALWLERHAELIARGDAGVWLAGADNPSPIAPCLPQLPLVAGDFPNVSARAGDSRGSLSPSPFGHPGRFGPIGRLAPAPTFFA